MTKTIGALAHGRDNNFNLLRMIAATAVLVSHSFPLTLGPAALQPLQAITGFRLGTIAVQAFFAISGFFIAKSFDRRSSAVDFIVARAVRLYPALLVALAITALGLGPAITTLPLPAYFADRLTWTYIPVNAALRTLQEMLPGVFGDNPTALAVNGSLWTLYSEVKCYALVALIGLFGLLRPRTFLIAMAVMAAYQLRGRIHDPFADGAVFVALSLPFFVGTACYVYRAAIPHSGWLAVALALAAAAAWPIPALYAVLFPAALAYAVLWLGLARVPGLLSYNRLGDYSYGMYIYAWPIQQAVVSVMAIRSPWMLVAIATPATLLCAVLSWSLIEAPILDRRRSISDAVARRLPMPARTI